MSSWSRLLLYTAGVVLFLCAGTQADLCNIHGAASVYHYVQCPEKCCSEAIFNSLFHPFYPVNVGRCCSNSSTNLNRGIGIGIVSGLAIAALIAVLTLVTIRIYKRTNKKQTDQTKMKPADSSPVFIDMPSNSISPAVPPTTHIMK